MGATDSKLAFRKSVFQLFEEKNISSAADDFWSKFWTLPETANDVFSLVSVADIRRTRDTARGNLEILIDKVVRQMHAIVHDPKFPSEEHSALHLLNCCRVLTRVLPLLFEQGDDNWEKTFFWSQSSSASTNLPCRGDALLSLVIRCLFLTGFTLPSNLKLESQNINFVIWETGIGSSTPIGSFRDNESNRVEVLRLLLVLLSKSMYFPASQYLIKQNADRWLQSLVSSTEKRVVLCLLCSLLNTSCNYNPLTWGGASAAVVFNDTREQLVTLSIRTLALLLDAYSPASMQHLAESPLDDTLAIAEGASSVAKEWDLASQHNLFIYYMSKIHRAQDFQFLMDGFYRTLSYPLQGFNTYFPSSIKRNLCYYEMTTLCWKIIQINSRFRSYLVETERAYDLMVAVLHHAMENRLDPSQLGQVRVSCLVLQCLSLDRRFGDKINKVFEASSYTALPSSVQIDGVADFKGTYADFLILSLYKLIATTGGQLSILYPCFISIISNLAPYLKHISLASSTKLLSLFGSFSAPGFLLADSRNPVLAQYLLDTFTSVIRSHGSENVPLLYCIVQSNAKFERLNALDLADWTGQANPPPSPPTLETRDDGKGPVTRPSIAPGTGFVPTDAWLQEWRQQWPLDSILLWLEHLLPAIDGLDETRAQSVIKSYVTKQEHLPQIVHQFRPIPWSQAVVVGTRSAFWAHVYLTTPAATSPWQSTAIRLFQIKNSSAN
ncbi:high-temperature-induced dauer-formation protein-domain-containing protein [Gongronella butleri]|nr:high-temperature-induced dauer-formation protein-domain-containing protein [Gongronella butleri]